AVRPERVVQDGVETVPAPRLVRVAEIVGTSKTCGGPERNVAARAARRSEIRKRSRGPAVGTAGARGGAPPPRPGGGATWRQTMPRALRHSHSPALLPAFGVSGCQPPLQSQLDSLASESLVKRGLVGIGISVRLQDGRLLQSDAGFTDPSTMSAYSATGTR